LTDHDLVAATYTSRIREYERTGQRLYVATFEDGSTATFAVASAGHARIYAREFAVRIKGSRLTDVRWLR
jgi:hypothetical protein